MMRRQTARHHLRLLVSSLAMGVSLSATGQGTLADYHRAYSLYEKFQSSKVPHWAHDVAWSDSSALIHYYIDTPQGRRYICWDADKGTKQEFGSYEAMCEALQLPLPVQPQHEWGRHHKPHWMEVDEERETVAVPSPDGQWEAYIEGDNVVVHQVGQPYTQKKQLSQDGTPANYYSNRLLWSPDSRKLLACKRRPVPKRYIYYVESSPHDQLQPILHQQEYAKPGDELPQKLPVVFDVVTGQRVEADAQQIERQFSLDDFRWTEDSREVLMNYNQRGHHLYEVLAMNALTGRWRTVVSESSPRFVNYSRLWWHYTANGQHLVWTSERDNWNHIYMVYPTQQNTKNGLSPIRQITKGAWCVREIQRVDEQRQVIYFSASGMNKNEDPYLVHYYRIGMDGKGLVCLTPEHGNHQAVFDRNYRYLADTYSMVDCAPVTVLRSADDGHLLYTLEEADLTAIKQSGWVAPEVFVAKGRDGKTDMWGIIQRPTHFDASKKYPIIEYIYAGPGSAYTPKSFLSYNWNTTALAELGFIVVQLDAMGTSWRGKAFEEVCYKNLKDAGFPDRMAWIKAAAQRYPYMDVDHVGIFGASAGGQESTTAVLLHGDFYKAAYSACGCHDNRMDKIWWNEQWMGYPIDSSYVECSNVVLAPRLERPLMLVVGELDDNVDPASTYQVANALIKAGKDFELVVLPGVHHTMGERFGEHKRFDFFVRNLLHVVPPSWTEIKQ